MSLEKRIIHLEQYVLPKKRKTIRCVETEAEITDDPDVICWIVGVPEGHFRQSNDEIVRSDDSEPTEPN